PAGVSVWAVFRLRRTRGVTEAYRVDELVRADRRAGCRSDRADRSRRARRPGEFLVAARSGGDRSDSRYRAVSRKRARRDRADVCPDDVGRFGRIVASGRARGVVSGTLVAVASQRARRIRTRIPPVAAWRRARNLVHDRVRVAPLEQLDLARLARLAGAARARVSGACGRASEQSERKAESRVACGD